MPDVAPRYSSRDLAKAAGFRPPPSNVGWGRSFCGPRRFADPTTVYGPRHLDEVLAIVRLRRDNLTYQAIRTRLRAMSDAELASSRGRPPPCRLLRLWWSPPRRSPR